MYLYLSMDTNNVLEQIMGNGPVIIHFKTWAWSLSWTWT